MYKNALLQIAQFVKDKLNGFNSDILLGVENMHVTPNEKIDDSRRFGYTPYECIEFMTELKKICPFSVGINLDVGHARNNAPFSRTFQVGTWYSLVGKHTVGYHIHQVLNTNTGFINHAPITDVYGELISYASFFECWQRHMLNKAPLILEIREKNGYEITLNAFNFASKN